MADAPQSPFQVNAKLYYRIGEVSRIADVPVSALRFWESRFNGIRPRRSLAGHRLYRQSDLELILRIKKLLYEKKFTIDGARDHLKKERPNPSGLSTEKRELVRALRVELEQIRRLLD